MLEKLSAEEAAVKAAPDDGAVIRRSIQEHPAALQYASEAFRGDRRFLLGAAAHMIPKPVTKTDVEPLHSKVAELIEHSALEHHDRVKLVGAFDHILQHQVEICKKRTAPISKEEQGSFRPLRGEGKEAEAAKERAKKPANGVTDAKQEGKGLTQAEEIARACLEGHGLG